jgi:hypothetical protein
MRSTTSTTTVPTPNVYRGMRTPWGKADHATIITEGVGRVDTSGHGGMKLSRSRNAKVAACWRRTGGWYEEDCECAIVVLTFPELFDEKVRAGAERTARGYFPYAFAEVTGKPVALAESHVLRRHAFERENVRKLVTVAAWSHDNPSWPCVERRVNHVGVAATVGGNRLGAPTRYFLIGAHEYECRPEFGFVIDPEQHVEVYPKPEDCPSLTRARNDLP